MNVETVVLKVKDSKELERYMHLLEISTISREALKEDGEISIKYKGNNLENYIDGSTFFALYVAGRLLGTVYERLRKDDDWDDKARENAFDLLAGGIYSYLVDKHDGEVPAEKGLAMLDKSLSLMEEIASCADKKDETDGAQEAEIKVLRTQVESLQYALSQMEKEDA